MIRGRGFATWEWRSAVAAAALGAAFFLTPRQGLAGLETAAVVAPVPTKATRVVVVKSRRLLLLMQDREILRSFKIALGRNPVGPKREEGDGRTPEGRYRLDWRNPRSRFYRSLHISYPNENDRRQAEARNRPPGHGIMIHGLPNGRLVTPPDHTRWDWTEGCIALTNAEMDVVWRLVDDGTPIEIRP